MPVAGANPLTKWVARVGSTGIESFFFRRQADFQTFPPTTSHIVFESWQHRDPTDQPADIVHKALLAHARDEEVQGPRRGPVVLSAALSKALLYINRLRQGANIPTRILCLLASPDSSAQYIALMNCIFAAQAREEWELGRRRAGIACALFGLTSVPLWRRCVRSTLLQANFPRDVRRRKRSLITSHPPPPCLQRNNIVLDCCKIGLDEARFAQQAAALTGGIYHRVAEPAALLQYLLVRLGRLKAPQPVRLAKSQISSVSRSSPGRRWCSRRGQRRAPCCGRRRARGRRAARRACATGSPS